MTSGIDTGGITVYCEGTLELMWVVNSLGSGWAICNVQPKLFQNGTVYPFSVSVGDGNSVGASPVDSLGAPALAVGFNNGISGASSVGIGNSNTIQYQQGLALGNLNGTTGASNNQGSFLHGQNNRTFGLYSHCFGQKSKSNTHYSFVQASQSAGGSTLWGTTQYQRDVPCRQTTDATPTQLRVCAADTINDFTGKLSSGQALAFELSVVGWSHTLQESFAIWFRGLVQRTTGNVTSTVGITEITRVSTSGMTGCNVTVTPGTSIVINVVGLGF
jgi:hypothetical protein